MPLGGKIASVSLGQKPWTSSSSPVTWPIFSAFLSSSSKSMPSNHVQVFSLFILSPSLSLFPQNWGYFLILFSKCSFSSVTQSLTFLRQTKFPMFDFHHFTDWLELLFFYRFLARLKSCTWLCSWHAIWIYSWTSYPFYKTFMKVLFIASSLAIVWCMHFHPMVGEVMIGNSTLFAIISLLGQALLWHSSCMKSSLFKRSLTY